MIVLDISIVLDESLSLVEEGFIDKIRTKYQSKKIQKVARKEAAQYSGITNEIRNEIVPLFKSLISSKYSDLKGMEMLYDSDSISITSKSSNGIRIAIALIHSSELIEDEQQTLISSIMRDFKSLVKNKVKDPRIVDVGSSINYSYGEEFSVIVSAV